MRSEKDGIGLLAKLEYVIEILHGKHKNTATDEICNFTCDICIIVLIAAL